MAPCDALLVRLPAAGGTDRDVVAAAGELAAGCGLPVTGTRVLRALQSPEVYVYFEFAAPCAVDPDACARLAAAARARPAFAPGAPAVDRLQRVLAPPAASAGAPELYRYVVELDAEDGWWDALSHWYETDHMPGLAGVPGCVRAQRYLNRDGGPPSHACYDLTDPATITTAPWLAVRHSASSERVRAHFRNPKRTVFRVLG